MRLSIRSYPTRVVQVMFATLVALSVSQLPKALAQTAATNLTGISWKLVSWGSPDNLSEPQMGDRDITAQFTSDEKENLVTGTGGCNFWGANYQISDNMLQVLPDHFDVTADGCSTQAIQNQEERYFNALLGAQSYQINEEGQLEISYQTNTETGVLIFEPQ